MLLEIVSFDLASESKEVFAGITDPHPAKKTNKIGVQLQKEELQQLTEALKTFIIQTPFNAMQNP
jgi:hypothetical protein